MTLFVGGLRKVERQQQLQQQGQRQGQRQGKAPRQRQKQQQVLRLRRRMTTKKQGKSGSIYGKIQGSFALLRMTTRGLLRMTTRGLGRMATMGLAGWRLWVGRCVFLSWFVVFLRLRRAVLLRRWVGHWELSGIRRAMVNCVDTCLKIPVRLRLGLAGEVHWPLFWEAVASE